MAETQKTENVEDEEQRLANIEEDEWMIRDCQVYKDEYNECLSLKGRFQQYFVYGKTLDCNHWKKDYNSCCKWQDDKNIRAAESLIASEKHRRMERLRAHYRNDVWKKRDEPPKEWDKPLPDWMVKRDENTYLALKAKEISQGIDEEKSKNSLCSIM